MVTRHAVLVLVSLVLLSLLLPFGGIVAAESDDGEPASDSHDANPLANTVESTTEDGDTLTEDATQNSTTTDSIDLNATERTGDTVDAVPTGSIEDTDGLTGDVDDTDASESAPDRQPADALATVERLSWEIDSVSVTTQPDGDDTLRVVIEKADLDGDHQATPATVDELAQILAAAAADPDVVITLIDDGSLESTVEVVDGAADGGESRGPTQTVTEPGADADDDGDRALAGFGLPDAGGPVQFVPPLAVGSFLLLNPLAGLLSSLVAFLAEWAGRLAAVLRYSRRDGSDPLEHETRTRIDELVTDTPGISLSDLADRLETPLSTIRYHVKILERERYLTSRKHQGNRRLYPMGAETKNEELTAAMDNESTATIIESLARQGQATVGDIVDDVGTTYATVSHHLSRLADAGVVQKEKDGRCTVSKLDPSARTALHRELDRPHASPARQASSAD